MSSKSGSIYAISSAFGTFISAFNSLETEEKVDVLNTSPALKVGKAT
jgi:hypothetical protein